MAAKLKLPPYQPVEIWGGMECTINRVGDEYFDQFSYSGHRTRDGDIKMFAGLGLKKLRYPILWEHHQPNKDNAINWDATTSKLQETRFNGVDIIAGLVHHGSGPAWVNITDDSFAVGLQQYATQVALQFPWIDYYTPVNEPLTTARFCGLYGLWHPHAKSDTNFCRILINECKGTLLAMQAIRCINPNAKLVQTEDIGSVHSTPALNYQADFENKRRWLTYDLLCGRVNKDHELWNYLVGCDIRAEELDYFIANAWPPDIMGINYYLTSERYLDDDKIDYPAHFHGGNGRDTYADVEAVRVGKICPDGLQKLLQEAWQRYGLPMAVTEAHLHCTREEQMRWLSYVWASANELKNQGIQIVAITAWALLGSSGWDRLLTCPPGNYEPGIFDISDGSPRPTVLCAMLHTYSENKTFVHPALNSPGWWQRSCRVSYGHDHFFTPVLPTGPALALSGAHSSDLAQICRKRCLPVAEIQEMPITHFPVLATITVNDYMEVRCDGRDELIIYLTNGNLHDCLNAGLDLFIDGEVGNWEMADNGKLTRISFTIQQIAS